MKRSHTVTRCVIVPERNIDRYYKRYNYEKQPGVWANCIRTERGKVTSLCINRYWRFLG